MEESSFHAWNSIRTWQTLLGGVGSNSDQVMYGFGFNDLLYGLHSFRNYFRTRTRLSLKLYLPNSFDLSLSEKDLILFAWNHYLTNSHWTISFRIILIRIQTLHYPRLFSEPSFSELDEIIVWRTLFQLAYLFQNRINSYPNSALPRLFSELSFSELNVF